MTAEVKKSGESLNRMPLNERANMIAYLAYWSTQGKDAEFTNPSEFIKHFEAEIESYANDKTLSVIEKAVGDERPGRPDKHIPDEAARVSIHVQEEMADRILSRVKQMVGE